MDAESCTGRKHKQNTLSWVSLPLGLPICTVCTYNSTCCCTADNNLSTSLSLLQTCIYLSERSLTEPSRGCLCAVAPGSRFPPDEGTETRAVYLQQQSRVTAVGGRTRLSGTPLGLRSRHSAIMALCIHMAACVLTGWSNRPSFNCWTPWGRKSWPHETLSKTLWGYCVYKGV